MGRSSITRQVLVLTSFALFVVLASWVSVARQGTSSAPVQRLEILQTSNGPVVHGLFVPFGKAVPPPGNCPPNVSCPTGSQNQGNAMCNEMTKTASEMCPVHPTCPSSTCSPTFKTECCASGCVQISPPSCVGCNRTGRCVP